MKLLVCALMMALSSTAYAQDEKEISELLANPAAAKANAAAKALDPACNDKGCYAYIEQLIVWADRGLTTVVLKGVSQISSSITSCTPGQGNRFNLELSDPGADATMAAILAAHHAEQRLFLRVVGNADGGCKIAYIITPTG